MKGYFSQVLAASVFILLLFSLAFSMTYNDRLVPAAVIDSSKITLILDAGHGGTDGGAVSITGKPESEINLEITLRARDLAAFMGTSPLMTRETEDIEYPEDADTIRLKKVYDQKSRVAFINSAENPVLISIHQNKYESSRASGSQVFYTNGAEEFAANMQNRLTELLMPSNKRTASKISDSIYLMSHITCPAILIECGFISNPDEARLLETGDYQKKLAVIIINEYFTYYNP